jgi:hypothetical protein
MTGKAFSKRTAQLKATCDMTAVAAASLVLHASERVIARKPWVC